ncbi:uncharacterized protein V1516DRAFT_711286 [Lipomyces oligophaga]|uniref:uncharacterized protein n=1 Tax=Lipomyces oligophaga TaxID=45792 RepID=UPI0034CE49FB
MRKQTATSVVAGDGSDNSNNSNLDPSAITSPIKREGISTTSGSGKQSQTLCKNILIHGYCKFENNGCIFRHDTPQSVSRTSQPAVKAEILKPRLTVDSPSFTPTLTTRSVTATKSPALSIRSADAPAFVPRNATTPVMTDVTKDYSNSSIDVYNQKPPMQSQFGSSFSEVPQGVSSHIGVDPNSRYDFSSVPTYATPSHELFYPQSQPPQYLPIQYHLYAPHQYHKANLQPYQRNVRYFFMSDTLREELQSKNEATLQTLPTSGLPEAVQMYYSLVPIDTTAEKSSRVFGYTSWIYKAFSKTDGNTYALRRLEGFQLTDEKAIATVQQWSRILSAGLVTLYEAFTTRAFGDNSIIFVYDYYPLSYTLFDAHFGPNLRYPLVRNNLGQLVPSVPEQVLWSYLVQLSSTLRTIHNAGLSARILDASKIIVSSKMRLRLTAVGIFDVLAAQGLNGAEENLLALQQDDLFNLGRLILSIACANPVIQSNSGSFSLISKSVEQLGKYYSMELQNAVMYLFSGKLEPDSTSRNIDDFIRLIATYYQQNLDSSLHYQDDLESELSKEVENGRLFRLLCKFNFINERPEYDHDPAWSETGDRYLLKLFRDYVFHQSDEAGHPVLDMGHVLRCLNKLDAGVDEKIMLVSRDELSCLIVSYKELKNCVDMVFRDLSRPST